MKMKAVSKFLSSVVVHVSGFSIGWQIANHIKGEPVDWLVIGLCSFYLVVDFTRMISRYD